jgi:hypothetical protein
MSFTCWRPRTAARRRRIAKTCKKIQPRNHARETLTHKVAGTVGETVSAAKDTARDAKKVAQIRAKAEPAS